jgi:hypothetical protein
MTKACKVLKFEEVKEKERSLNSNGQPLVTTTNKSLGDSHQNSNPLPASPPSITPSVTGPPNPSPPPVSKKRKATSNIKPANRRKRHANNEPRWIPDTLRLFTNAPFLTSTAPFRFGTFHPERTNDVDDAMEPFTRPTLPLHPVRRTHRSTLSASSSVTSGSEGRPSLDDDESYEERDSYEECPEYPYHPSSWNEHWQRLPGPGLLASDELVHRPSIARRWLSFKS